MTWLTLRGLRLPLCPPRFSVTEAQRLLSTPVSQPEVGDEEPPEVKTVLDKKHGILRISQTGKRWESVVGLEVHAQVAANSKLFSSAPTSFNRPVNSQVSYFDASVPGTLPQLNQRCVDAGIETALALGGNINLVSYFDRKHYFYADLPAGYQITQQRRPISQGGSLEFPVNSEEIRKSVYTKKVDIVQIQLEQDSGKSLHDESTGESFIDLNRCGSGLLEIVFGPCLQHGEEASALARELILILNRIGACRGRMERGELRVDANISVREPGGELGVRTEVKNLNSLRSVHRAVEYEVSRQIELLERGDQVENQTMGFHFNTRRTFSMRDKERKQDYRFMPEPNLPPLVLSPGHVTRLASRLPELPATTRARLTGEYGLTPEYAALLVDLPHLLKFFEDCVSRGAVNYKLLAETIILKIQDHLNKSGDSVSSLSPVSLVSLISNRSDKLISHTAFSKVLTLVLNGDTREPEAIVEENQWYLNRDPRVIQEFVLECVEKYPELVQKYVLAKEKKKKTILTKLLNEINRDEYEKCERLDMTVFTPALKDTLDTIK